MNALKFGIVVAAAACAVLTQGAEKRPNILFILADDQSPFDLKMYTPDSTLDTPVLDQLAAEGMIFNGAHHLRTDRG